MGGNDERQKRLFLNLGLECKAAGDRSLRPRRDRANEALESPVLRFPGIQATSGGSSVAPVKQLPALFFHIPGSIRDERTLIEQLDSCLPFRWFVGMATEHPVWSTSTFSQDRDRLIGRDHRRRGLAPG